MKRVFFMIITVLICGLMFTNCSSDKAAPNEEAPAVLQYVETDLGGCNLKSLLKNDDWEIKDNEVVITISDDLVHIFLGYNYGCKGEPFETQVEIIDDDINIYIIDNYTGEARPTCMCYYTFDFVFQYQGKLVQSYKIILLNDSEQVVISEGVIE